MSNKIITLSILCFFSVLSIFSQHRKMELANEKYDQMAYMDAARLYEVILKKGVENEEIFKKLGNSYYYNAKFHLAEKWYAKLFLLNKEQDKQSVLKYLHVLKVLGDFEKIEKLEEWSNLHINGVNIAKKIDSLNSSSGYFFNFETNNITIKIEDAGINSEDADFGVSFIHGDIIFTSTRKISGSTKDIFQWTNRPFSKLYKASRETSGSFKKPKEFLKGIRTKFNESTPTFSKDGKTMYFTRNSLLKNEKKKGDVVVQLKLFKASKEEGIWTKVTELPFNSDDYNCAHPVLSNDGKTLFFVSNMPGTVGASDLFKVKINEDNTYSKPKNLGTSINTKGRETFPFISKSNELFFSSDGHFGIGGLDIFVAKINSDSTFSRILNVGDPINSSKDDFGFFVGEGSGEGFFSSNRDGGHGSDDIYKFTIVPIFDEIEKTPSPAIAETILFNGTVADAANQEKLKGVEVTLYASESNEILSQVYTNEEGSYTSTINKNQDIRIEFKIKTHSLAQEQFSSLSVNNPTKLICKDVLMEPILDAKVLANLNEIYFDLNNSSLRNDAALELDKLVDLLLKTYPEMTIKIESHTDPIGSHAYNDMLSQRRAESTFKYLILKGVPKERIVSYKGYGKRKPVNKCTNLKDCESSELELNRRTEFPIVTLNK